MVAGKERNLGIDMLCCLGVMMLLGLQYIETLGYFTEPVTSWAFAAPVAVRWFCLSGAALLSAGTGYILSTKKFSFGYFKILIRLIYVYVVCSAIAIIIRLTMLQEQMSFGEIVQAFLRFHTTDTGTFAGMYFGILLAAPFLNAAIQGLPNRQARLLFLCITAAFGTMQPILYIGEVYVLPTWCIGLFPVAAYIGGACIKRYMKRKRLVMLFVMIGILGAETAVVMVSSLQAGTLYCPWLDSLAALPVFVIGMCLLSLFHSQKNGKGSIHRFFAGAAGGALAALLLGDPLIDITMGALAERFPGVEFRFWLGFAVIPVLFILCSVFGLILQLPLLGIRSLFESAEAEKDEDDDMPGPRKKRRSADVSMPERVHTKPGRAASDHDSRHTIRVAVSEPEADLFLTQPAEEIPAGLREMAFPPPKPTAPEPEPEPMPEPAPQHEFPTMKIPAQRPAAPTPKPPKRQATLEEILEMTKNESEREEDSVSDLLNRLSH